MNNYFVLLFAGLGLIFGSFINVVVFRVAAKQSWISGRSHCPKCKHPLGIWDLIPLLSWLWLKGRCRYCRAAISWQYPLVELATGLLFAAVGFLFGLSLITFFYLSITVFLIIIFVYDLRYGLILDKITVPAIILAVVGNLYFGSQWWDLALGAGLAGGLFLLQFLLSRGKWIGGGDLRLGVLMGVILGWQQTLAALFLAYVFGALVAVGLLVSRRKKINDSVPFGTFLTAATLLAWWFGQDLIRWYVALFL